MSKAIEQLREASTMYDSGATEAKLRKTFGNGIGIKLYWICFFNERYPDCALISRLLGKQIDFTRIKYPELQAFSQRLSRAALPAYNEKLAKANRAPVELLSVNEFKSWVYGLIPPTLLDILRQRANSLTKEQIAAIMKILKQ